MLFTAVFVVYAVELIFSMHYQSINQPITLFAQLLCTITNAQSQVVDNGQENQSEIVLWRDAPADAVDQLDPRVSKLFMCRLIRFLDVFLGSHIQYA